MRAGQLRHEIEIQRDIGTRDAAGQRTSSWRYYARTYAKIINVGGGEVIRGRQVHSNASVVMETRYVEGVKPHMRVQFRNRDNELRTLNIVAAYDPEERGKELRIECEEVT